MTVTQKVIERFVYEGLLLHNQYIGRRWRITLGDVLEAGKAEPRVWELLPGIILYRPTLLFQLQRDLKHYTDLTKLIQNFETLPTPFTWKQLPIGDLRKAAHQIMQKTSQQRKDQRLRNLNLRVSESDLAALDQLSQKMGMNKSEVVRKLIERAES